MPVGKSATIHRLTGQFIHSEMKPTTGAQVTLVYWPGKCAVTQQEMIIILQTDQNRIPGPYAEMDQENLCNFVYDDLGKDNNVQIGTLGSWFWNNWPFRKSGTNG